MKINTVRIAASQMAIRSPGKKAALNHEPFENVAEGIQSIVTSARCVHAIVGI
jgi:hypothetical protein